MCIDTCITQMRSNLINKCFNLTNNNNNNNNNSNSNNNMANLCVHIVKWIKWICGYEYNLNTYCILVCI